MRRAILRPSPVPSRLDDRNGCCVSASWPRGHSRARIRDRDLDRPVATLRVDTRRASRCQGLRRVDEQIEKTVCLVLVECGLPILTGR